MISSTDLKGAKPPKAPKRKGPGPSPHGTKATAAAAAALHTSQHFNSAKKHPKTSAGPNPAHKSFRKQVAPIFIVPHRQRTPAVASMGRPSQPHGYQWGLDGVVTGATGPVLASTPAQAAQELSIVVPLSCQSIAKALGRVNNRIAAN